MLSSPKYPHHQPQVVGMHHVDMTPGSKQIDGRRRKKTQLRRLQLLSTSQMLQIVTAMHACCSR